MPLDHIEFFLDGRRRRALAGRASSLAIPLDFDGPQPGFFGAPPAASAPLVTDGFIGDPAAGGSCRCTTLTLTPHCNGTHTECVGHVVREPVNVREVAPGGLLVTGLVSASPVVAPTGTERSDPPPRPGDRWITAAVLAAAAGAVTPAVEALAVRTLPNPPEKRWRQHGTVGDIPAYFTLDAIEWIVARGIGHLLTDLPSIDRFEDNGRLAGHRAFWGLPPGSTRLDEATRPCATITELAYVDAGLADGLYLLDLQLPAFGGDAAPSRPLLYPLEPDAT